MEKQGAGRGVLKVSRDELEDMDDCNGNDERICSTNEEHHRKPNPRNEKTGSAIPVNPFPTVAVSRKPSTILAAKWETMFQRLLAYKERTGSTLVPNRYDDDPSLGAWVSTQRRQYRVLMSGSCESTPMNPERARRLEAVGFVWRTTDPRHVPWETRFEQLVEFKKEYGHAQVPIGYEKNMKLANWVSTQRQEAKLLRLGKPSRLTNERIKMLDSLGFIWKAQRGGSRKRKKPPISSGASSHAKKPGVDVAASAASASRVDNLPDQVALSASDPHKEGTAAVASAMKPQSNYTDQYRQKAAETTAMKLQSNDSLMVDESKSGSSQPTAGACINTAAFPVGSPTTDSQGSRIVLNSHERVQRPNSELSIGLAGASEGHFLKSGKSHSAQEQMRCSILKIENL